MYPSAALGLAAPRSAVCARVCRGGPAISSTARLCPALRPLGHDVSHMRSIFLSVTAGNMFWFAYAKARGPAWARPATKILP